MFNMGGDFMTGFIGFLGSWLILSAIVIFFFGVKDEKARGTVTLVCLPIAILAGCMASASKEKAPEKLALGTQGDTFAQVEKTLQDFKTKYGTGTNQIQQTEIRFERGKALCAIGYQEFTTKVKVDSIVTSKNGDARLQFISDGGTGFNPKDSYGRGTPVHTLMMNVNEGDEVVIKFKFERDPTGKDCFYSERMTEMGNMTDPSFYVDLISVQSFGKNPGIAVAAAADKQAEGAATSQVETSEVPEPATVQPNQQPVAQAAPQPAPQAAQIAWLPNLPRYDVVSNCRSLGSYGGTVSYGLIESCQTSEAEDAQAINAYWNRIPRETQAHCDEMARYGGSGSYSLLDSCIKSEMESRGRVG